MKYTSSQAAKLLRKLNEERQLIADEENSSYAFIAAIEEDIEDVRPNYEYEETLAKLEELDLKIRKVKHAINVFNTTTIVPEFGITIDEMLVLIPQLSGKKYRLLNMCKMKPKERVSSYNSNFIEYKYANFDIAKAKEDYEAVSDTLARAQQALDELNNSATMEIDI